MGKGLIRLENPDHGPDEEPEYYLEWSSVVDAPVTRGMTLDELEKYIRSEYGRQGMRELADRVRACQERGTSYHGDTLEGVLSVNRAGPNEEKLTEREILQHYCLRKSEDQ